MMYIHIVNPKEPIITFLLLCPADRPVRQLIGLYEGGSWVETGLLFTSTEGPVQCPECDPIVI